MSTGDSGTNCRGFPSDFSHSQPQATTAYTNSFAPSTVPSRRASYESGSSSSTLRGNSPPPTSQSQSGYLNSANFFPFTSGSSTANHWPSQSNASTSSYGNTTTGDAPQASSFFAYNMSQGSEAQPSFTAFTTPGVPHFGSPPHSHTMTDASEVDDSQDPATNRPSTPTQSTHNGSTFNITNVSQPSTGQSGYQTTTNRAARWPQSRTTIHSRAEFTYSRVRGGRIGKSTATHQDRGADHSKLSSMRPSSMASVPYQTPVDTAFGSLLQNSRLDSTQSEIGRTGLLSTWYTRASGAIGSYVTKRTIGEDAFGKGGF